MANWKFSTSHTQSFKECARLGFLTYYYGGKGLTRKGLNLAQSTGTLCHRILALGLQDHLGLDGICQRQIEVWRAEIFEAGLDAEVPELGYEISRQSALAEALCRAWFKIRFPFIQNFYEILEIEEEQEIDLGNGQILMTRPDIGALRRKSDGELVALEFKTTGKNSQNFFESWRYSTQTLTHLLALEHKYKVKGASVLMEFLYKGYKKWNKLREMDIYYSPLIRGRKVTEPFGGTSVYLWDEKSGVAFDPWTEMSMKEWIEEKVPEQVLGEHLFTKEVFRNDIEIERWIRQTRIQQWNIQKGTYALRGAPTEEVATEIMDEYFPGNFDQSCFSNKYFEKCVMLPICWGQIDDPLGSREYVERKPHHPREFEA